MTPKQRFCEIIGESITANGLAALAVADDILQGKAVIIQTYINSWSSPSLSGVAQDVQDLYRRSSPALIAFGLYTHCLCFGSHYRHAFAGLNDTVLAREWQRKAARALSTLTAYSKAHSGFPEGVFNLFYAADIRPTVQSRVGWFRRGRVEAAFRDRFATGLVLGMTVDTLTASSARSSGRQP